MRGLLVGVAAVAALGGGGAGGARGRRVAEGGGPGRAAAVRAARWCKFETAAKHLHTHQAASTRPRSATARLRNATQEYYNGVSVQQASSQEYADARQHLLIGLVRYKEGLVLYRKALIALTHHHASQAKNRVKLAVRRFKTAGKEFLKAQVLVQ